jgi:hypothetical protein
MARVVSRRLLTVEARVRSQLVHVRFMMDKLENDRLFSEYFGFPMSISLHQCSMPIFIDMFLLTGQKGEAWGHSKKQCSFGNR